MTYIRNLLAARKSVVLAFFIGLVVGCALEQGSIRVVLSYLLHILLSWRDVLLNCAIIIPLGLKRSAGSDRLLKQSKPYKYGITVQEMKYLQDALEPYRLGVSPETFREMCNFANGRQRVLRAMIKRGYHDKDIMNSLRSSLLTFLKALINDYMFKQWGVAPSSDNLTAVNAVSTPKKGVVNRAV